MLVRGRLGLALLALALLAGVQAAPAAAEGEPDTGAFNAFNLKGSNGYRLNVWAVSGREYRQGQILIFAARKRQSVVYLAPAKVTDTRVEADLGLLGEIDVTFQPSGQRGVVHPVCDRSQRTTYDKGTYVGTMDLRGEEGYTRVQTESAPYSLHPFIDLLCAGAGSGEGVGYGLPGARLRARAKFAEGEIIELQANQNKPGARVRITASTQERRDRVHISREISFTHPAGALDWAPNLGTATLAPPAPFSGAARYRRDAKLGNQWIGNLVVDFPGRSNVSLTGARFDPTLVRAQFTVDRPNLLRK